MAEESLYEPVKERLEQLFERVGKKVYLEISAASFSERIQRAIPQGREIVFSFLSRSKPDLIGFLEPATAMGWITVEIKEKALTLDDIYQAKKYKEVFDAAYGFLVSASPIPEGLRRLCRLPPSILSSASNYRRFLVLAQFESASREFVNWFEENPFENSWRWQ